MINAGGGTAKDNPVFGRMGAGGFKSGVVFARTPLGSITGVEDSGGPGPTSLTIPNVTANAGDLIILGAGLDDGGSGSSDCNWGGTALTNIALDPGTSLEISIWALLVTVGGTHGLTLNLLGESHAACIIATKITGATQLVSPSTSDTVVPATTVTTGPLSALVVSCGIAFNASLLPLGAPAHPAGAWSTGWTQGVLAFTTGGTVSNCSLSEAFRLSVPVGAFNLTNNGLSNVEHNLGAALAIP